MNEIILSTQNGEPVASSREVAKRFGKEHKHVLAAIRQILAAENSATKFFHETAFEYRGQRFPEYLMNRDGFSLLAMGFTGKEAVQWKLKYIQAFNEIYAALAAVQSELKAPKGQMNTFGGYRYRSCEDILEAVKPILKAHDLLLTLSDEPKVLEGWHYIEATAKLESLDGGCISVKAYAREPEQKTKMDAAQVTGTSSSYARKYALNGLFCIDDTKDADTDEYHAAEGRNPAGVNKPQKQPAQKREAPAPKREAPAPKSQPVQEKSFVCACCGKPLQPVTYKGRTVEPAETAASTKKKFGRVLCWTCAQKQPKED